MVGRALHADDLAKGQARYGDAGERFRYHADTEACGHQRQHGEHIGRAFDDAQRNAGRGNRGKIAAKSDFHFQRRSHEGLVGQHVRRDFLVLGEAVPFRHRHAKRLPIDDEAGQFGWKLNRFAREADVERAVDECFELRDGLHLRDLKRRVGMLGPEAGNFRRNQAAATGREHVADGNRAGIAAPGLPAHQFGVGGLPERFLRFDQEAFAGIGEGDRALCSTGE